jgi:aldehyde dehydrogenase (NAD+)
MGVVGVIAPDSPPVLGLLSMVAPVIACGNTVVALASEKVPYPAILLGEMLATSDLPAGVVNLLTGFRRELIPTFATHAHLRAVYAAVEGEDRKALRLGGAESVKRVRFVGRDEPWFSEAPGGLDAIRDFVELKTIWHPIGS